MTPAMSELVERLRAIRACATHYALMDMVGALPTPLTTANSCDTCAAIVVGAVAEECAKAADYFSSDRLASNIASAIREAFCKEKP